MRGSNKILDTESGWMSGVLSVSRKLKPKCFQREGGCGVWNTHKAYSCHRTPEAREVVAEGALRAGVQDRVGRTDASRCLSPSDPGGMLFWRFELEKS